MLDDRPHGSHALDPDELLGGPPVRLDDRFDLDEILGVDFLHFVLDGLVFAIGHLLTTDELIAIRDG